MESRAFDTKNTNYIFEAKNILENEAKPYAKGIETLVWIKNLLGKKLLQIIRRFFFFKSGISPKPSQALNKKFFKFDPTAWVNFISFSFLCASKIFLQFFFFIYTSLSLLYANDFSFLSADTIISISFSQSSLYLPLTSYR